MRSQVTSTSVILWSLLNVVRAGALVARQSDANSRTIDLRGPQVIYEGPWEDITSPCNLGSIARRSDNSRAEDAKAVITFSGMLLRPCFDNQDPCHD